MSEKNAEQTANQTNAEVGLPSLADFKNLSTEEMEAKLNAAGAFKEKAPVQEEQDSATNEEVSDEEEASEEDSQDEEEAKDEEAESKPDIKTPESKKDKQDEDGDLKKSYKALQAEFTRRSQKLADLEKRLAQIESKPDPAKLPEKISKLAQLAKGDEKAEKFMSAIEEAIEEQVQARLNDAVEKKVKPIEQRDIERTESENLSTWSKQADEFLKSPLADLTNELNEIIAEQFSSNEEMLDAAKKDPNLFTKFRRELKDRHTDKVAEVLQKSKSKPKQDPLGRNREVKQTGVSGKSKTSVPEKGTMDDVDVFRAASTEEKEKYLRAKGLLNY